MSSADLANRVEAASRKRADMQERCNGDGTFTIGDAKMMALLRGENG